MPRQRAPHLRLLQPSAPTAGDADEAELVGRAAKGIQAAQGALFRHYAPLLLPMLVRLLASRSDAEDALQDAFLVAFRDLPKLREREAFAGWLRRIAVHQAHRRFRRRRLLGMLGLDRSTPDATLARLADAGVSPDDRAELGRLDEVLARLPGPERSAWVLRHVEGCELTEVAALCGCSLATAKRRIAAAQVRVARHVDIEEDRDE